MTFFFNPSSIRLGLPTLLAKYSFDDVSQAIRSLDINKGLKYHVLTDKHNFKDECKGDCILDVAKKIKEKNSIHKHKEKGEEIPVIEGEGKCKHTCLIEVHLSIPPNKEEWEVQTAFHKEPCKA